jgi:hypothetical protein
VSTLTKVFVVLLVVLSLLLAAGVVTFVHTADATKTAHDTTVADLNNARADNARLSSQVNTMQTTFTVALSEKDSTIAGLRNELGGLQQQVAQRDGQIAELTANLGLATAAQTTANDALKAMQAAYTERSKVYDDLRTNFDKQQKQLVDANIHIDDQANVIDVTRRQNKFYGEQVAQLQTDLSKASALLRQNGIAMGGPAGSALVNPEPNVPVNARVEETRTIGGVRYATINAGSADSIATKMQLKVVDPRSNQFLGYLVVDQVFPHQAMGRLEGPRVGEVQPQVTEVRSSL